MKFLDLNRHRPKITKNKGNSRPNVAKNSEFLPEGEYINKMINGDCLEKLKGIPDDSVDLILSDLPYGMNKAKWDKIPTAETLMECNRVLKKGGFFVGFIYSWGNLLEQHLANLRAARFDTGFTPLFWVHQNNRPAPPYIKKNIERVKGKGAAENFEGACASYRPCTVVDFIIVAQKPMEEKSAYLQAFANGKGITWLDKGRIPKHENGVPKLEESGYLASNIIVSDNALGKHSEKYDLHRWASVNLSHLPKEILETYPCFVVRRPSDQEKNAGLSGEGNTHETVKPIEVMGYLLSIFSREGDVVMDMFAGSGTTCLTAALLNRRYIGIELNPGYCEIARKRIEHIQQAKASGGNEMIEGIYRKILPSTAGKDNPIEIVREKVITHLMSEFFSRTVEKPKVTPDVSKGSSSPLASISLPPINAGSSGSKTASSNPLEGMFKPKKQLDGLINQDGVGASEDDGTVRRRPGAPRLSLQEAFARHHVKTVDRRSSAKSKPAFF